MVRSDEYVLWFQIAVYDPNRVDGREPGADFTADVAAQLLGQTPKLVAQFAQRLSIDVLHHQEMMSADRVAIECPHDVSMFNGLPDLRLEQEALEEALRLEQVAMDDLQCDARTWSEAGDLAFHPGSVDGPHPARAEFKLNDVRTEGLSLHASSVATQRSRRRARRGSHNLRLRYFGIGGIFNPSRSALARWTSQLQCARHAALKRAHFIFLNVFANASL